MGCPAWTLTETSHNRVNYKISPNTDVTSISGVLHLVWPLRQSLTSMVKPTRSRNSSWHSLWDLRGTQAPPLRQSNNTLGGTVCGIHIIVLEFPQGPVCGIRIIVLEFPQGTVFGIYLIVLEFPQGLVYIGYQSLREIFSFSKRSIGHFTWYAVSISIAFPRPNVRAGGLRLTVLRMARK